MLDIDKIRADFNIFKNKGNSTPIYFDSACMSLKPISVIDSMNDYYLNYPACAGRSSYKLGNAVTKKVKETRELVAKFINAKTENEIIFTRNTTEGINLLANSIGLKSGDTVLISDKEHNSNLVPWLLIRDKIGINVKIISSNDDGSFNLDNLRQLITGAKLISIVHTSNLDGVTNPVKEIVNIAHENNVLVFVDAAQSIAHNKINVRDLDVDFLAFSGHKMLGPTGTGVFYGKHALLEKLQPFMVGGDTVDYTTYTDYKFLPVPEKFEAGLQDYAGIIGLGEAIKYLSKLDFNEIKEHELKLNTYITEELRKIPKIKIIGPEDPKDRSGIINFYIEGTDMHKIAIMLDEMANIAIRSGRHCVHSWFEGKKIYNSARVSLYVYNTIEEARIFITNLNKIIKIL
ncbi:MAG TPA: aminotransferase class V-fold PLP-dependent enzyme [Candidatus Paceibacterota bacterium]|nr:aminotransferase class V-fold PLP-dependent enzyme [Candidatus Paceibacterota bacterium]